MPNYFFHTQDGNLVLDNVGTELADLGAAKRAAVRLLGGIIADHSRDFLERGSLKMMITNERGFLLFALELSAVDPPTLRPRLVREFL